MDKYLRITEEIKELELILRGKRKELQLEAREIALKKKDEGVMEWLYNGKKFEIYKEITAQRSDKQFYVYYPQYTKTFKMVDKSKLLKDVKSGKVDGKDLKYLRYTETLSLRPKKIPFSRKS